MSVILRVQKDYTFLTLLEAADFSCPFPLGKVVFQSAFLTNITEHELVGRFDQGISSSKVIAIVATSGIVLLKGESPKLFFEAWFMSELEHQQLPKKAPDTICAPPESVLARNRR